MKHALIVIAVALLVAGCNPNREGTGNNGGNSGGGSQPSGGTGSGTGR
jgi:hypothetical protein